MAWARLASRSRLRPAASAAGRSRHASTPAPPPPPSPPTTRTVPAATSAPPLRRLLLLPRHRFADATPSASTAWLLGARWRQGHGRRCFASAAYPAQATPGEASELVDVPLAQTGEGIAECELLRWFVAEGDQVDEFQPLCEVQSDKATIEITSRFKGKVHKIHFVPGDIVKVGETLLKMVVGDSQIVSPDNIVPSAGKDGRVLKEDVLNYAVSKGVCKQQSLASEGNIGQVELLEEGKALLDEDFYEDKKILLRGYQRSMVKSMSLAAKVPHFHYLEEINCDSLVQLKTTFQNENKDQTIKHTFLPFLIKSLSMALSKYPMLNSSFIEETNEVVFKGPHNIGVAMATTHGLVVPNIKKVQSLSILEITKELARLHEMASQNRLSAADIEGGTITLSNIGAIGGKFGSPLLNLPEVAIIALGRIQKLPRFDDDENVYPSSIINVTVGADHRVVDGATVARFCNEWKSLVEKPELLLLHMR
uniref:Dihydrolipoamide acetyltransferase component of pyruvate dehydrogenase complex n=1 Tax=Zea mays TaxID=4577 RepID=A0A804N2W7_MAIZE